MLNKKILVTGGAGYIGSHANALLNTLGFQTIVLDNLVYGHKESLHYAPLPFSYTSPFTKSPTISSQYLDSKTHNTQDSVLNFLTQLEQNFNGGGGVNTPDSILYNNCLLYTSDAADETHEV